MTSTIRYTKISMIGLIFLLTTLGELQRRFIQRSHKKSTRISMRTKWSYRNKWLSFFVPIAICFSLIALSLEIVKAVGLMLVEINVIAVLSFLIILFNSSLIQSVPFALMRHKRDQAIIYSSPFKKEYKK